MKDPVRRDNVLTIVGLSVISAVFVLAVYLPGHKAGARIRKEIQAAEQSIHDIPLRLAELEALQRDVDRRAAYLKQTAGLVPAMAGLHDVIQDVARSGKLAGLEVTRLEPLEPVAFKSYRGLPFRLSFRGPFRGFLEFSKGLESKSRLMSIEEISLRRQNTKDTQVIDGDIRFYVYVNDSGSLDFDENRKSADARSADKEIVPRQLEASLSR